jgi:hypothetical protein
LFYFNILNLLRKFRTKGFRKDEIECPTRGHQRKLTLEQLQLLIKNHPNQNTKKRSNKTPFIESNATRSELP